jgi:hypothetical protein
MFEKPMTGTGGHIDEGGPAALAKDRPHIDVRAVIAIAIVALKETAVPSGEVTSPANLVNAAAVTTAGTDDLKGAWG